jgi:hypothetical protein
LPPDQRSLSEEDWTLTLATHCISPEMAASIQSGGIEIARFLVARQEALEHQLDAFLQQRCEWEFEDTPPLDSLVMDDEEEDEARELSDDESSQF